MREKQKQSSSTSGNTATRLFLCVLPETHFTKNGQTSFNRGQNSFHQGQNSFHPTIKILFSKAQNLFPETKTLTFSAVLHVLIGKVTWYGAKSNLKNPVFGYFQELIVNFNKKVKIYERRANQRGQNSFHKMPKLIFLGFCASGRDLILHKKSLFK